MKKKPLFILVAFATLSVAVFLRTRASRLQTTFHTAVTAEGVKVFGNFSTGWVGCRGAYLATASGTKMTLFTVPLMIKRAYLCN